VGEHDGAAYYTIGQRQGLQLGGEGEPWYVVNKDAAANLVFVERGRNHPALFSSRLQLETLSWITPPPQYPFQCQAKIRYRQREEFCTLQSVDNHIECHFDQPQWAAAPGQSVVFYQQDLCLGGGIIQHAYTQRD
jgi:tRNA-specific 2-thiouridylase